MLQIIVMVCVNFNIHKMIYQTNKLKQITEIGFN